MSVESNNKDYSVVLICYDHGEVTSGALIGTIVDKKRLDHAYPGLKVGNQLILPNEDLNRIIKGNTDD